MSAEELVLVDEKNWRLEARCRDYDPDIFYTETEIGERRAKQICRECVVIVPCLEEALERPEKFGVWGGTTEKERRSILRRQRKEYRTAKGA